MGHGRNAGIGTRTQIARNPRFRGHPDPRGNVDMSGKAHLSAHLAPSTNGCRTGDANLTGHDAPGSNTDIMTNLDLIIQLHASLDNRIPQRAAIDAGVGSNLNIILQHHTTGLRNLQMLTTCPCITEAIRADDGPSLQDHAVSQLRAILNDDIGVNDAIPSDTNPMTNDHARTNDRMIADLNLRPNHDMSADIDMRAQFGRLMENCGIVNMPTSLGQRVKMSLKQSEGQIRILDLDHGTGTNLRFPLTDQNDPSAGGRKLGTIFRIGEKRGLAWTGISQRIDTLDAGFRVSIDQFTAHKPGDLRQRQFMIG